ncbi:ABC transporter permease [Propionibacterium australiense]|uniref:Binding-protein-dependent transport system inner membrane component n=1 Tax=Propionibacterium australiense TaxID=119981 RepID=A0A383S518_9ACTN|nr:ABC transporter permease [Propionibacterium australiense]RLP11737.1 ABC transporter permease subunit [Propionibacterium australiense]SYZ32484.1 Binding-protein-dependent transport system inner membrane component [Propionibacterium australiense]VEH90119.1 Putative aliphatic sulfonates transport permease protein ssuC [Propionibacterium australiense]
MRRKRLNPLARLGAGFAGLCCLFGLWAWASGHQPAYVLPSPADTWRALVTMAGTGTLWGPLGVTLWRALLGLGLACFIGIGWGSLSAASQVFDAFTRSWLSLLMAVPPIVIVVIGMLALGPTAGVVLLVVVLVSVPLITTSTRDAISQVDPDLLEMAHAFDRGPAWRGRHVIGPAVVPPVLSAVTVAAGQSLRVCVMAELLSTSTGLGARMQMARTAINTDQVFALAVVLAAFSLLVELVVLAPVRSRVNRAQRDAAPAPAACSLSPPHTIRFIRFPSKEMHQ